MIALVISDGIFLHAALKFVKQLSGHDLSSGILVGERQYAVAVDAPEGLEVRVLGVHGHGVVPRVEEILDDQLHDFEVADHVVVIEGIGRQDDLDATRMAMRIFAVLRVLGEHVTVLDFEGFADSIGHSGSSLVAK